MWCHEQHEGKLQSKSHQIGIGMPTVLQSKATQINFIREMIYLAFVRSLAARNEPPKTATVEGFQ